MHLLFLGTAASEGYPDAFCNCSNCARARQLGGASLRKRSAVLINNDLLIDFGPDLMAAALQHNLSFANVHYCLQTHEHSDHLDTSHFFSRSQFCGVQGTPRLHYYASQGAIEKLFSTFLDYKIDLPVNDIDLGDQMNLCIHMIAPQDEFAVGPYNVLSLHANHDPSITAMLYVIERNDRVLFYATDTGELSEVTWQALKEHGRKFTMVAMDHTFGFAGRSNGHMNREQFLEQIERMRSEDLLADDARIFAHHLAHHSNPPHPELVEYAQQHGYEVAYDGLRVEV